MKVLRPFDNTILRHRLRHSFRRVPKGIPFTSITSVLAVSLACVSDAGVSFVLVVAPVDSDPRPDLCSPSQMALEDPVGGLSAVSAVALPPLPSAIVIGSLMVVGESGLGLALLSALLLSLLLPLVSSLDVAIVDISFSSTAVTPASPNCVSMVV